MMRRIAVVVALAGLAAACASSDDPPPAATADAAPGATSEAGAATTTAQPVVVPDGFERVAATVTEADGETCDVCLWLADTSERRSRGLMFVTDLGGADGMAFVYSGPHTGNFWMKNTVLPLSIAFFDADGAHLAEFDMEPCVTSTCPRYRTPRDFVVAVETTQGDLGDLGIGPGSTLELTDLPCP